MDAVRPCFRTAAALLLLALPAGCSMARARPSFFPLGIFGVEDPAAMRLLGEEGFNAAQVPGSPGRLRELASAARKAGIRLLVPPQELLQSDSKPEGLPALAWYLADEPDVHRMKPVDLSALDRRVRAWSPGTPTAFVLGDGNAAGAYAEAADVLMADWYPVPHLPLTSAGDRVRRAVEAAKGKSVWAVIQAMDWRDYPQRDPRKPRIGRFPNIGELRFMTYDAIVQGAGGVWYFAYTRPDGRPLSDAPELWFALTEVAREIRALLPILEGGTPAAPPFPSDREGLAAKAWRFRGRDYVLVLNRRELPSPAPKELLRTGWRPLFELRRDPRDSLLKIGGDYFLKPFQALVLEGPFGR